MAVIIDIGNERNIHPVNKLDVGRRLARWALAKNYGRKGLVYSGPLYRSHQVGDGQVVVRFDHVGGGLIVGEKSGTDPVREVPDGKLARFAVAGEDRVWHWADARIDQDAVVVSSGDVPHPVAVRYAYTMHPVGANLYNREGLPASPFRTDDWEPETED
jgi:sialate O-acetylesterase